MRHHPGGSLLTLAVILLLGVLIPLAGGPGLVVGAAGAGNGAPGRAALERAFQAQATPAGFWALAPGLQTPRNNPNATALPNGKVLVVGGTDANGNFVPTSELYDPITGTSAYTANSPPIPLSDAVAAALPNGKVLRAGGIDESQAGRPASSAAEAYDPATGLWATIPSMRVARQGAQWASLPDGTVLVFGGEGGPRRARRPSGPPRCTRRPRIAGRRPPTL